MYPIMKCGHRANAHQGDKPVCAICVGIRPGADEIDPNPPALAGRTAKCTYCGNSAPSDGDFVPFLELRPNQEFDSYYCGCFGWD